MKHIYIILLIITNLAYSQTKIPKRSIPTIEEDMLSESVITKLNSAGMEGQDTIDSNIHYYVDELSDLQGDLTVARNKRIIILESIDLQGTTVILPPFATLNFEGGSIHNGVLSGDRTWIDHPRLTQIFGLDLDFSGSFDYAQLYPEWFGCRTGNVIDNGEFNLPYFDKLFEFARDYGSGNVHIPVEGTYFFSAANPIDKLGTLDINGKWGSGSGSGEFSPDGIITVYSNTNVVCSDKVKFKVEGTVPSPINNTNQYHLLMFDRAHNSSWDGGEFIGNLLEEGNKDYHTAVTFYGDCYNVTVKNTKIHGFPSDAFRAKVSSNFQGRTPPVWEVGGIDKSNGLDEVNNAVSRSTVYFDLTQSMVTELGWTRAIDNGNAYNQLKTPRGEFDIYYYDVNDNFISVVETQTMYEKLWLPPNATQARVVVYGNTADYELAFQAQEYPTNIHIEKNHIYDVGRQGVSLSGGQEWYIDKNVFHDIDGAPGYVIDIEDFRWANRRVYFTNNTWWNVIGGVRIYSVKTMRIDGNYQLKGNNFNLAIVGNTDYETPAVSGSHLSEDVIVSNNYFEHSRITSDVGYKFINNTYTHSGIVIRPGVISHDNLYIDSTLGISDLGDDFSISDYTGTKYYIDVRRERLLNTTSKYRQFKDASFNVSAGIRNPENIIIKDIYIDGENRIYSFRNENKDVTVDGLTLRNTSSHIRLSGNVSRLNSDQDVHVRIDQNQDVDIKIKDWKVIGKIQIRAINGTLDDKCNIEIDGLDIEATSSGGLVNFEGGNDINTLKITNSKFVDRISTGANWSMINGVDFQNVSIKKNEFTSASAGNIIDIGTSINTGFVYKDNILDNVLLNSRTTDISRNNIINGREKSVYPSYTDNTAALVDLEVGEYYIHATKGLTVVE